MSATSTIEWTDATWNPTTGCAEVSPGCEHCYARTFAERWRGTPGHPYEQGFDVRLWPHRLTLPLRWRTPRKVFVNSMSDLFIDDVGDEFVARVLAVMALAARHTFQVLTKRHGRMRSLLGRAGFRAQVAEHATDLIGSRPWRRWQLDLGGQRLAGDSGHGGGWTTTPTPAGNLWTPPWPLPNVWLGVSAEDQQRAGLRIPALLDAPAAVRFVSAEPLLGPLDLSTWLRPVPACRHASPQDGLCAHPRAATPECHRFSDCPASPEHWHGLDWVIVGGESGPGARPMDPAWAHDVVQQCDITSVAVFVKQLGTPWARASGVHRVDPKGSHWAHWPPSLRIRQYPRVGAVGVHGRR